MPLTLRGLGAYIFLDQGICRLSIKAESVFERFHIRALLQEGFLQPVSSSMEILLQERATRPFKICTSGKRATPSATPRQLLGCTFCMTEGEKAESTTLDYKDSLEAAKRRHREAALRATLLR